MRARLQDQADRCLSVARQPRWMARFFKLCAALLFAALSLWLFAALFNDRFVNPDDPELRAAQDLANAVGGLVAWTSLGAAAVLGHGALRGAARGS